MQLDNFKLNTLASKYNLNRRLNIVEKESGYLSGMLGRYLVQTHYKKIPIYVEIAIFEGGGELDFDWMSSDFKEREEEIDKLINKEIDSDHYYYIENNAADMLGQEYAKIESEWPGTVWDYLKIQMKNIQKEEGNNFQKILPMFIARFDIEDLKGYIEKLEKKEG